MGRYMPESSRFGSIHDGDDSHRAVPFRVAAPVPVPRKGMIGNQCAVCGTAHRKKNQLVKHAQATGHNIEHFVTQGFPRKSPQCPVCAKAFTTSAGAASHAAQLHEIA